MKIKFAELKKIVEGVVKEALSEQEQEEAPAPEVDPRKVTDAEKATDKMDAQKALITLLQFVDTPDEIENLIVSIIQRLDPNKVTDQEVKIAFRALYNDAMAKNLERGGKAAAGE